MAVRYTQNPRGAVRPERTAMRSYSSIARLFAAFLAVLAWPAAAQDLPGRVGRLAWTEGEVAIYQDADRGWDDAYLNSPLTSRNSVWTEPGARAEVQVGPIALRLDSQSQLDVSRIDDSTLDATLEQGEMAVRVHHFRSGDVVRLSTPQASFLLQGTGRYRLESDPDNGESRIAVLDGTARLEGASVRAGAGQSIVVWGGDAPSYALQDAYDTDFDRWAAARDEHWVESHAPTYVSYDMTGYEDLDAYGSWGDDPTYGAVWYPTSVTADWAPYREGRWAYVSPWGWTWVDAEPWGYAPFHYGRWVRIHERWAWCPGRRVDRPAWAPALVGFIGAGVAASAASGPVVGWYPLAPSESYRPWYSAGNAYVKRVNAAVVNVPEATAREHRDANRERGVTAVRREALVAQQPIARSRVQLAAAQLRNAAPAAAPASVLPSAREARQAHEAARAPRPAGPPANRVARDNERAAPAPQGGNPLARPQFAKPRTAPQPAPRTAAAPPANVPLARGAGPRGERPPAERATNEVPGRQEQDRVAQQQRQQQERATREAQQQQGRSSRQAQQQQERVAQQQQQRAAQEQQRVAQQAQQQQQRTAQEQQRAAQQQQQRAAQEQRAAQQAQQQQQRAAREQQRVAQQSQQQQQRAAQEQRAAQQAQQQQQRAAQEQHRVAQQAQQQQQRAAQEQRVAQQAQQQQQRAAQEQQRAAQQAQHEAQQAQQRTEHGRQRDEARADQDRKAQGHGEGG